MGPRKRSKLNPKAEAGTASQASSKPPNPDGQVPEPIASSETAHDSSSKVVRLDPATPASDGVSAPQSAKSWYGGTWSRKATPVTQIAKESISAAGGAASDAVASARANTPELSTTPLKSPTAYLSQGRVGSSRSLPLAATTTKLNITSNAPKSENGAAFKGLPTNPDSSVQEQFPEAKVAPSTAVEKAEKVPTSQAKSVTDDPKAHHNSSLHESKIERGSAGKWLPWFSRVEDSTENAAVTSDRPDGEQNGNAVKDDPEHTTTKVPGEEQDILQERRRKSDPSPLPTAAQEEVPPRSWLGLWGNSTKQSQSGVGTEVTALNKSDATLPDPLTAPKPSPQPVDVGKSYGWAFWSKEQPKDDDREGTSRVGSDSGELAQAGSPSQSKPETTVIDKARGVPTKVEKRQRPQSLDANGDSKKPKGVSATSKKASSDNATPIPSNSKSTNETNGITRRPSDNLLLPAIERTYNDAGKPGLIQQLSLLLQLGGSPEPKHVSIVQNPHHIKRALAIGIHGYFPAPLIRSVLGQPTGTSIRFANSAADAIKKWTHNQGYSCEIIEKVALEGEGKIAERIELLWKLMLNWIEKIRKADFVMIACHSQGVPVALILMAKLIAFGCLNSAKVAVCAMAGVNQGPFGDYKSRWISGSAGELFDFAQPDSQVSKDYKAALDVSLRFGVKVVYVGSIDDQLVSLESSTFGSISHPSIYRAVFIDGRIYAPDFLTHLVGFALKLRNLGISDHGLIRELSTPLAGSLYTGEGHSRVYDDEAVYYLAVQYALETTTLSHMPMQTHLESPITTQNPYILPFAMRGLLEEDLVRKDLYGEVTELIKLFDAWKPSTKVLKDVKFRLEGVRSKL